MVVDAGCGAGRQTLVLAKELGTLVHAVDSHRPFLGHLEQQAKAAGVGHLVRTHCLDMQDIPSIFRRVDLLWSEGAAYSIGFANALGTWATVIDPGDFAVVSELSWLRETPPNGVHEFFESAYPEMQTIQKNVQIARASGYELLETLTLPREAWVEGYYAILGPRAKALLDHPDESVRQFASEMITEIEVFGESEDSYGYVLYVLQRT